MSRSFPQCSIVFSIKTAHCHVPCHIFGLRRYKITVWDKKFPILMICHTLCSLIQYQKITVFSGIKYINFHSSLVSKPLLETLTLAIALPGYLSWRVFIYSYFSSPESKTYTEEFYMLIYAPKIAIFLKAFKNESNYFLYFCKDKNSQHWLQYIYIQARGSYNHMCNHTNLLFCILNETAIFEFLMKRCVFWYYLQGCYSGSMSCYRCYCKI